MKTWIFQERVFQQGPQVSQAPQVVQEVQPLLREVFPECWERDRVDLARVSAKPRSILCNIAFEHGLEMSVDQVRAAARSLVAYEPVGEEVNMQAAAAPSRDLRARSGEEEKSLEKKWSSPQKSVMFSFTEKDTVLDLQGHLAPMLQPKKSTAEFIHEKQTERANEESARVIKQNKYDLLVTNVHK